MACALFAVLLLLAAAAFAENNGYVYFHIPFVTVYFWIDIRYRAPRRFSNILDT